jgi:hypothetical protein
MSNWHFSLDSISQAASALISLIAIIVSLIILANSKARAKLKSTLFLAKEEAGDQSLEARINALEEKISSPVTELNASLDEDALSSLRGKMHLELMTRMPEFINEHLHSLAEGGDELVKALTRRVDTVAQNYIENIPYSEKLKSAAYTEIWDARAKSVKAFSETVNIQLRSANNIRVFMMNLFMIFNVGILFLLAFSSEKFTDRLSLSIAGIYVSLSAFIIYIYRASNARSASLLSLKEDEKKLQDVFHFLNNFKKGNTYTSNDVEIIRLLMINRFERERGSEHPYEVILKGVTNSTVLLRGGKVANTSKKD